MSWYPETKLTEEEDFYLDSLQKVFKVIDAEKKIVPYILQPHQKDWHRYDVNLIQGHLHRIVIKSRNTSFTTSALISMLAAVADNPSGSSQIIPFVMLNYTRSIDLIRNCKFLIKNMTPLKSDNGSLWPFDPAGVNFDRVQSIVFPNGVEFRAFPSSGSSAETIRGLRIGGAAGVIDESNFMRCFEDIYTSLRDTSAGSKNDKTVFQINIGTTLKGKTTPFHIWYEKIKKDNQDKFKIFYWPVFEPGKFNIKLPITEQNLVPIVPWHSLKELEGKRIESERRFREEFLCETVDSDEAFYPTELLVNCFNGELKNDEPKVGKIYWMGVDIAATNDYFTIAIFETGEVNKMQFLYYNRGVQLNEMQNFCDNLIKYWKPVHVRIDANGIGFQIGQFLQGKYGSVVDPVRGATIKGMDKLTSLSITEYMHTNLKTLMTFGKVELIQDNLLASHFSMWEQKTSGRIEAASNAELGHGDIVVAIALALLPEEYKHSKSNFPMESNIRKFVGEVKKTGRTILWK